MRDTIHSPTSLLMEILEIIGKHFYDPKFNGLLREQVRQKYEREFLSKTESDVPSIINQMLSELRASHTHYFTKHDPEYYQLLSIFNSGSFSQEVKKLFPSGVIRYPTIGAITTRTGTGVFISSVLDGGPAALAGLKSGDRIISIDGTAFSPVASLAEIGSRVIYVTVQRTEDPTSLVYVKVKPEMVEPSEFFLKAMQESRELIHVGNITIAYIHVWSYAGDAYQRLLEEELTNGMLKDADGLILDLRDGLGGADPSYLELFTHRTVVLSSTPSFQESAINSRYVDVTWRKPVTMLINEGTRSGKEVLAYAFKNFNIGKLIGTKTAGAVVLGRPFLLKDDNLLYLAVGDIYVNGERLEGVGVVPDIDIPMPLEYREGLDMQKQQAINDLASVVRQVQPL